jgi:hypothetical protein
MSAPVRIRPRSVPFEVNEDPRRLDEMYFRLLGPGGDQLLSEEVKWLAVTHKSFDHGRRGFNDRLAYLGASTRMPRDIPMLKFFGGSRGHADMFLDAQVAE